MISVHSSLDVRKAGRYGEDGMVFLTPKSCGRHVSMNACLQSHQEIKSRRMVRTDGHYAAWYGALR